MTICSEGCASLGHGGSETVGEELMWPDNTVSCDILSMQVILSQSSHCFCIQKVTKKREKYELILQITCVDTKH